MRTLLPASRQSNLNTQNNGTPECPGCGERKCRYARSSRCKDCDSAAGRRKHRTLEGHASRAYWDQHGQDYSRDELLNWILNETEYPRIFAEWKASGFARSSSPTVYRVVTADGFKLDNLDVLPWKEARKRLAIPGGK